MRFDLFLHDEEETAETFLVERSVPAKAHVEGRCRVWDGVYYVFDVFYACAVSAMDVSRVRGHDMLLGFDCDS